MINTYLNQTVTLKTKGAVNEYNEPTYTTTTIPARFQYKRKMVRNKMGESIISEAVCYTTTKIKPDDLITFDGIDWVVISVADVRDINGVISHYKAVM